MGLEADCTVRIGRRSAAGHARLEEKELYFRAASGALRLKIPFAEMKSAEAKRGVLAVKWPGGDAAFALGAQAEKWALKIRYPRSRLEKLGVKPGSVVSVLAVGDAAFGKELRQRTTHVTAGTPRKDSDLIFLAVNGTAELRSLRALRRALQPAGAIWVLWPKGQPHIKEDDVRRAALAAGLVDVKVVAFSETHSGLKLMIPRAQR